MCALQLEKIDFGQFVLMMVTYALFETVEILKFCFFMFDKDKNGFIHKDEFVLFVEMINGKGGASANTVQSITQLDVDGEKATLALLLGTEVPDYYYLLRALIF